MGKYRKTSKKQKEIDAATISSAKTDLVDDFVKAMDEAALVSDTSAIRDTKTVREDAVWLTENLLTFPDFCESADHMNFPPLSDRQKMVAEYMFGNDPKKIFDNNRNTAILVWGKGSFDENSEIISCDGERMTIKECADRGLPVRLWSRDPDTGRVVKVVSTPAIKKPEPENCFRVKTSFGHISDISEDHKYFTVRGWTKLKDISVGDWILGGKPTMPDNIYDEPEKLCRWAGYMIGDGCLSGGKLQFFCSTLKPDIISDYLSVVEGFGATACVLPHNTPASRVVTLKFGSGVKGSNVLTKHARRLGIYGKTAKDKRIPVQIMFSSEASRRSFLESLYATNGWISRHSRSRGGWEIGYLAKNRKLIEDLDFMLRGFGVVGKIRAKYVTYKGERREYWQLIICHRAEQRKFSALLKIPGKSVAQSAMDLHLSVATQERGFSCPSELTALCATAVAGMPGRAGANLRGRSKAVQSYSYETVSVIDGMDVLANEDVVWEQVVSVEPLGMRDVYTFTVPFTKNYLQGGLFHHNSGKDTISALMMLYVVYILLNIKNPQRYLSLPDNVNIDLLNVAASKEQAQQVYFQILKTLTLNWPWLRSQYDLVMNGRFFSSGNADDSESFNKITVTNDAVIFPKNIRCFSGSCEAESLEGKNLLCFVLDEADAFKTGSQLRSAAKIYRTVRTSAVSRFGKKYKGFIISYPRSSKGFIMTMYEQSKKFLNMYGDIAKTWEAKPRDMFSADTFQFEGYDVPMEFYEDFRLDPSGSKSAYICDPPEVESLYLDEPEKVDLATAGAGRALFDFEDSATAEYVRKKVVRSPFMYDKSVAHILLLDLSLKKHSTALSLMHRHEDKIIVDFSTAWIPNDKKKLQVDLLNVEEVIETVRGSVNVQALYCDRWNCLSGSTVIPLLDGRKLTIRELSEKYPDGGFWVYSVDGGKVVAAKASAAKKTFSGAPVLKVSLDNGEHVIATPEHRFMLRDGTYREAKDLRPGDSLMPLYTRLSEYKRDGLAGYEKVYHPDGRWGFTHQAVAKSIGLPVKKGMTVHHRDFNKLNNSPDNLQSMTSRDHLAYHRSLRSAIEPQRLAGLRKWWANPENRTKRIRQMRSSMLRRWKDPMAARQFVDGQKKAVAAASASESVRIVRSVAFRENVINAGKKHSANKFTAEDKAKIAESMRARWMDKSYRERMKNTPGRSEYKNHTVVSVEPCGSSDVYDIEVPGTNNFAIGQGIFVHNSAMLVQKLRSRGTKAETVSLDHDDFELFKRLLYAGNIRLPKNARLLKELKSLQQITPQRVAHPDTDGSHGDMAITIVMGTKMLAKTDKSDGGLGLLAEGEFVGDNLNGIEDEGGEYVPESLPGIVVDGFSM